MSFQDWLYLDPLLKRAIVMEVEETLGKKEAARADQERKFQSMMAEQSSSLKFPMNPNSNIQGIIGR